MNMEESKFAQLNPEQLEKINELEKNIGVTLIAYDFQVGRQEEGGNGNAEGSHLS